MADIEIYMNGVLEKIVEDYVLEIPLKNFIEKALQDRDIPNTFNYECTENQIFISKIV